MKLKPNYTVGQPLIIKGSLRGTYAGDAAFQNDQGQTVAWGVLVKMDDGSKVVFSQKEVKPAAYVQ